MYVLFKCFGKIHKGLIKEKWINNFIIIADNGLDYLINKKDILYVVDDNSNEILREYNECNEYEYRYNEQSDSSYCTISIPQGYIVGNDILNINTDHAYVIDWNTYANDN